jgi:hypothetical protein
MAAQIQQTAPFNALTAAREVVEGQEAFRRRMFDKDCAAGLIEEDHEFRPMTAEQIEQEARKKAQAALAWAASPRRAFLRAVKELDAIGYGSEAYKLECLYRCGIADEKTPEDAFRKAVGAAYAVLEQINHPEARAAGMALSELLIGEPMKRAA